MSGQVHGPPVRPRVAFSQPARDSSVLGADAEAQNLSASAARGAVFERERGREITYRAAVWIRLALAAREYRAVARGGGEHFRLVKADVSEQRAQRLDARQEPVVNRLL